MAEYRLAISMADSYGRAVRRSFTLEAIDQPTAMTAAGTFISDYANATGADILWYQVGEEITYTDAATAGSNRDEGATLVMRKADNKKATVNIPAPEATLFNADGTVDLADTVVTALMGHFLSGVVRISDHEVVTALVEGRLDK